MARPSRWNFTSSWNRAWVPTTTLAAPRAIASSCARFSLRARLPASRASSTSERRQPLGELRVVLLGEDLGGCHDGHLVAALNGLQSRQRGNHGLAAAHVALQQPLHGMRPGEVGANLTQHALLGPRQLERQSGEQLRR